ncbi:MAG: alpha/beta fold hydrolase [Betaproteobacteria bacterium]
MKTPATMPAKCLLFTRAAALAFAALCTSAFAQPVAELPPSKEGDYIARDFKFKSGEVMPELKIHYTTFGQPVRDASGRVTNAVLMLHGTGGSGSSLIRPIFANVLFGPGQLLDASRYYLILPDGLGHGKSSKPSDGLRMKFPQYDYDDMVLAQKRLLEEGLGVNHLRLILGTSMGCMHAWVWGETSPGYADALMPLACQPVALAGRNRMWRKMLINAIRDDPEWKGGNYTTQPAAGVKAAAQFLVLAGAAPLQAQKSYPTREGADKFTDVAVARAASGIDANDLLYAVSASRNYDPSAKLESIIVPVMYINSADDFINPPELGIAEREIKRVKKGRFVLLPATEETYGHGTHTRAEVWKKYLWELLDSSRK